jgi:hypothetical protein
VVDAAYRPVAEADEWLLQVRLGRDRAESTTEASLDQSQVARV